MGRVIMCTGRQAQTPYCFKTTGFCVYSLEELCYYIYNDLQVISEELFDTELIRFIGDELGLKERSDFLNNLIQKHVSLKDMVVSILCSADYYDVSEIKLLLTQIDNLYQMKPVQRRKLQADYSMYHNKWKQAEKEYTEMIASGEVNMLDDSEYGGLLHNLAVLQVKASAFSAAAELFLKAYEKNKREESLKQYLYALKAGKQDDLFESEIKIYGEIPGLLEKIRSELSEVAQNEKNNSILRMIARLKGLKEKGQFTEYYQMTDALLKQLKENYRMETEMNCPKIMSTEALYEQSDGNCDTVHGDDTESKGR